MRISLEGIKAKLFIIKNRFIGVVSFFWLDAFQTMAIVWSCTSIFKLKSSPREGCSIQRHSCRLLGEESVICSLMNFKILLFSEDSANISMLK